MNIPALLKFLEGKKTYCVAGAAISYLIACQLVGKKPSPEIMGIFASLGLATLRAGIDRVRILALCLLPLFLLSAGCVSYSHSRQAGGVQERVRFISFFSGSKASAIKARTADANGYVREVSVGAFSTKPDANTITNSVAAGVSAATH